MGLHALPWPVQQLEALGEAIVEMRVTLSYFIEPKPGRRGGFARIQHRYQSCGLRFEVKRPQESLGSSDNGLTGPLVMTMENMPGL